MDVIEIESLESVKGACPNDAVMLRYSGSRWNCFTGSCHSYVCPACNARYETKRPNIKGFK